LEMVEGIDRLKLDGKLIYCRQGDITDSELEAIVNAANNHLWMGAGVAGAIKRKGGKSIEDEAVEKGPIQVGQAVITGAGKLKARYVIHAAVMGQDLHTNEELIKMATRSSLEQAEKSRLMSIDFPALGTGVGGFPVDRCAELMITEAMLFLRGSTHLKKVGFVLFDEESYQMFVKTLKKMSGLV
jgi:O-acetyl-ADP-ribose deacetylase (regulator of RNase III)